MKSSKSEVVYFILTILVVSASAFLYVVFGNRHQANLSPQSHLKSNDVPKESAISKPEDVRLAEEQLDKLDKDLTSENLNEAQIAVDAVTTESSKPELQDRLNALATALEEVIQAEQLVVQAESFLSYPNFELAQNTVNSLTREPEKAELQTRLNTVKANLDAYTQANNTNYTGNNTYTGNTGSTGQ